MSRERPKTTPPRPTIPVGTKVRLASGIAGEIVRVRRRKWAKRYGIRSADLPAPVLVRRAEFEVLA